ncbi:Protein of unknown function [Gryllus bimaculatus]|nr:Protein of unknown function [Gryllus bimaculatus]
MDMSFGSKLGGSDIDSAFTFTEDSIEDTFYAVDPSASSYSETQEIGRFLVLNSVRKV